MTDDRKPSDEAAMLRLRIPHEMREQLKVAAKSNGRTMNAEVVARLQEVDDLRDGAVHLNEEILRLRGAARALRLDNEKLEERLANEEAYVLTGELRAAVLEAASKNRRTVSAEMTDRLVASFRDLPPEAVAWVYNFIFDNVVKASPDILRLYPKLSVETIAFVDINLVPSELRNLVAQLREMEGLSRALDDILSAMDDMAENMVIAGAQHFPEMAELRDRWIAEESSAKSVITENAHEGDGKPKE